MIKLQANYKLDKL